MNKSNTPAFLLVAAVGLMMGFCHFAHSAETGIKNLKVSGTFDISGVTAGTGTVSFTTPTGPHQLFVGGGTYQDNVLAIKNSSVTLGSPKTVSGVDTGTDTFTSNFHGYTSGQLIRMTSTGTMPTGVTSGADYYIVGETTNTYQLSVRQGGSVLNVTGSGSGTITTTLVTYGYSAINLYGANDPSPGRATIFVNTSNRDYGDYMVFSTNPIGVSTNAPVGIEFGLERDDGGGSYYHHSMLNIDAFNKRTTIFSYVNNNPVGNVGIRVLPQNAGVTINTGTATGPIWANTEIGGGNGGLTFQDRSNSANCAAMWHDGGTLFIDVLSASNSPVANSGLGFFNTNLGTGARFGPLNDNVYNLGESGERWQTVYGYTGDFTTAITTAGTFNVTGASTLGTTTIGSGGVAMTRVKSGTTGAMTLGTITVTDTTISTSSRILVNRHTDGGTIGSSYSITRSAGASFTITAVGVAGVAVTTDTSTMDYVIIEP